ncbi:HNH endonuclease [Yangia mangrovi]|uniref:HNH endonuclease n=1 Tax=Alloyangia mangrovi TaxID=1779329 RepID=A0A2A3K179_9RHOB|nr:HNH endonuclease [Alloyangia mangrovi]MCT4369078.1 HNH endonuclease [Alloyangia mangrovi]
MSRAVPAWVGRTDDTPAPARVKARIVTRQGGVCGCGCGVKLGVAGEQIDFDHAQALILGGANDENNLRALRKPCHRAKTRADVQQKATEARKRNKHLGLAKPKRKMSYRRFDGTPVWKD